MTPQPEVSGRRGIANRILAIFSKAFNIDTCKQALSNLTTMPEEADDRIFYFCPHHGNAEMRATVPALSVSMDGRLQS